MKFKIGLKNKVFLGLSVVPKAAARLSWPLLSYPKVLFISKRNSK